VGANDNASGIAAVLDLARYLKERGTKRTWKFVLFGGEEIGCQGSRHYAAAGGTGGLVAALIFDCVGTGDQLDIATLAPAHAKYSFDPDTPTPLAGLCFQKAREMGVAVTATPFVGGSDYVSFVRHGVPAVALVSSPMGPIHTPGDNLQTI